MNITAVIDLLNKEQKINIPSEYYEHIKVWTHWWRGFYEPFHRFIERNSVSGEGTQIKRDMFTLKMAKKGCEDWASILLNEQTQITIDNGPSSMYVLGDEKTPGVLAKNKFWHKGNQLVERAFATGTGAVILRFKNMLVSPAGKIVPSPKTEIGFEYLPAGGIIPLTVRQGEIIDVAFASEVMVKGERFVYLETHILTGGKYTITNRYFKLEGGKETGALVEQPLPEGVAKEITLDTDIPMFAIVSPNIYNNIPDNNGLGISVFANAIDNLKGVDLAFNNFCRDFKLGGKKVFVNDSLTQKDDEGRIIMPDDVAQQLFLTVGANDFDSTKQQITEFNPALRVAENIDGLQAQLDYYSFAIGLGTKYYQFNLGRNGNAVGVVTATQYVGDNQKLIQNAHKHYIAVDSFLKALIKAILWAGKEVCSQNVDPDAMVSVEFEDSYITDKEAKREIDRQDVRDGAMPLYEYRMKWYGEDEETAKRMVKAPQTDDELLNFKGGAQ